MNIVSPIWIAWIFGLTTVYWIIPREWREIYSIAVTAAFLLIYSPASLLILTMLCIATFYCAQPHLISGTTVIGSISGIVVIYILFKIKMVPMPTMISQDVGLPIGLAFYILRCIHYILESYKGKLESHSFRNYCSYLFFLPTILYGPVHRFPEFLRDSRRYRWDSKIFTEGLERVLYGYVKVTFVSNLLFTQVLIAKIAYIEQQHSQLAIYLTVWCKAVSFYFLLSGYACVAIGFSLMLGYRIMEDFRWPFFSANISEFWGSWHISVSGWCRQYVRGSVVAVTRRPKLGVIATMLVFAMWHGISVHHFIWGIYNGLGLAVWQKYRELRGDKFRPSSILLRKIGKGFSIFVTAHFLLIGFFILKKPSREELVSILTRLFGWD